MHCVCSWCCVSSRLVTETVEVATAWAVIVTAIVTVAETGRRHGHRARDIFLTLYTHPTSKVLRKRDSRKGASAECRYFSTSRSRERRGVSYLRPCQSESRHRFDKQVKSEPIRCRALNGTRHESSITNRSTNDCRLGAVHRNRAHDSAPTDRELPGDSQSRQLPRPAITTTVSPRHTITT